MSTQIQAYSGSPSPGPMLQSDSLAIAEASLLFYSHHYKNLKCKIIEKSTSVVLCSKLINNCIETSFSINRDLEDFMIELYHNNAQVALFGFTYEDLERVIGEGTENQRDEQIRKRKYIKFKKENDCCSLYFTIEVKDIAGLEDPNSHQNYLYEDYVRNLANKLYRKLEKKAILRIKHIEKCKLEDKRLSLLERVDTNQLSKLGSNDCRQKQKLLLNTAAYSRQPHLAQSWIFGCQSSEQVPREMSSNSYCQRKREYKLKKIQERARRLFHKEIKEREEKSSWANPIIPEVPAAVRMCTNMRLLSEGIVFPTRVHSQNLEDLCIKTDGLLDGQLIDNQMSKLRQSYDCSNLFSSGNMKTNSSFQQTYLNRSIESAWRRKDKKATKTQQSRPLFLGQTTKLIERSTGDNWAKPHAKPPKQQMLKRKTFRFNKITMNSQCTESSHEQQKKMRQQKQKESRNGQKTVSKVR